MIKLVSQFDNEKSKITLATPTCGCCSCCCCCCIISTFATASISARNFGNFVAKKLPNDPKKIKSARKYGFWFPIGLTVLPILMLFFNTNSSGIIPTIIIYEIIYLLLISVAMNIKINLSGTTTRIIGFTILLIVFEVIGFFAGIYLSLYLGLIYLILAIAISILLICWGFGKKYDNLEEANKENLDDKNKENVQLNNNIDENEIENKVTEIAPIIKPIIEKKKCPNCGTENGINNKRCIYCAEFFEKNEE